MIESFQIEDCPIRSSNFVERSGEATTGSYDVCKGLCCTSGEINQPTDVAILKKTEKFYTDQEQTFKKGTFCYPSWYKSFNWVHFVRNP